MPIYIAVEVARRELEGRLLLGLVAAERGHDVVLGKIPHAALLAEELDGWQLPAGILHLKSVASSERIYGRFDALRERGMLISVQDEEHGLAGPDAYEEFGRARFPIDAVRRADLILAWGPHDGAWLTSRCSGLDTEVVETGSPRIDLWRPDVIGSVAADGGADSPHVLIVSSITPFNRNPLWLQLRQKRDGAFGPAFEGDDDPQEFLTYDRYSSRYSFVKHLVRAVRRLTKQFPSASFVFRPHHFEEPLAWPALIGEYTNLRVDSDATSRSLVENASVVIHCASSIAIEATVAARSVLTFCPVEGDWDDWTANRFGTHVTSIDDLLEAVRTRLDGELQRSRSATDEALLASRLSALDGPLAADRIVDEWERLMTPATGGRIERIASRTGPIESLRGPLRAARDTVRSIIAARRAERDDPTRSTKGPYAMEVEHKFPSLDVDALRADAARLAAHLGRFQDVEIIRIGDREVLLRAAGR